METCKSGSEGGCRKPVVYAIRRLCPTLRPFAEPYGEDNARKLRVYHYAQSGFHGQAGAGEALKYLRPSDVVYYECGSRTRAYQGGQLPCTVRK